MFLLISKIKFLQFDFMRYNLYHKWVTPWDDLNILIKSKLKKNPDKSHEKSHKKTILFSQGVFHKGIML